MSVSERATKLKFVIITLRLLMLLLNCKVNVSMKLSMMIVKIYSLLLFFYFSFDWHTWIFCYDTSSWDLLTIIDNNLSLSLFLFCIMMTNSPISHMHVYVERKLSPQYQMFSINICTFISFKKIYKNVDGKVYEVRSLLLVSIPSWRFISV